jgi:hypothetical protein
MDVLYQICGRKQERAVTPSYIYIHSQSSLFTGVRFLENPVNTELFHLHLHYACMPLLNTKIINESHENKEAASPCWSPSVTLCGRRLEIFRLLRVAMTSREVPMNGKKWVTLYFVRKSELADWLYWATNTHVKCNAVWRYAVVVNKTFIFK